MPTPQRLPIVNSDDGTWGDILRQFLMKEHYNDDTDNSVNGGHQKITIRAGTATAGTAPLKFTSGTLLSTPEAGAIEFNTDRLYFTQTTNTTRKTIAVYDDSSGATGDIYYRNSSGYFTRLGIGNTNDVLTVSGGVPTWAAPSGGATFSDSAFTIQDNGDNTKQLKFELSGISTGTTRTLTVPNANTTIVGTDVTQTLTNKWLQSRSGSTNAPGATPSLNTNNYDAYSFTGLNANITSMTTNLTGTPVIGQELTLIFSDDGTARNITWGPSFKSAGSAILLATTVANKEHVVKLIYNGSKWVCQFSDAAGYATGIDFPYTGAGSATPGASPSVTFTGYTPQGGDVVYFFINAQASQVSITVPSGWVNSLGGNTVSSAASSGVSAVAIYHVVTASEVSAGTTTYTATNLFTSASFRVLGMVVRGASDDPIGSTGTTSSATPTATHVIPGLSATGMGAGWTVVGGIAAGGNNTYTDPAGWTLIIKNSSGQFGVATYKNNNLTTANTAVSSQNITNSSSVAYAGITIALRP